MLFFIKLIFELIYLIFKHQIMLNIINMYNNFI